jgi:outer membrane protein assembly factor BamB
LSWIGGDEARVAGVFSPLALGAPRREALSMRTVCFLVSLAVAAPAQDWPMHRGDPSLGGVAAGSLPSDLALAWAFPTGGAITSSPAIADGVVYVGSDDQSVHAVELATGKKRWSFKTDDLIESSPLVRGGRVFIGSNDFFLYALDASTGELAWTAETGDKITGGASFVTTTDGKTHVLVGCYDTRVYCFDADSGRKLWSYETDNYVAGTPAVLGDRVVFGGCDAKLHVVSATTGERLAQVELGQDCHVAGSVALADGRVYFGHYGNAFVCVDLDRGEIVWRHDTRQAVFSSPAVGKDRVVFGCRDKKLYCLARADGAELWTFPTGRKIDSSPVICGDRVVFGSGDGRLYLLQLDDGKELWRYDLGQPVVSSPAVGGGTLVVGGGDGKLYAFRGAAAERGR